MSKSDEYGWVIEAAWTEAPTIKYWCGFVVTGGGLQHEWRNNASKAARFAREQDAKKMAITMFSDTGEAYRVVEHVWSVS